MECVQGALRKSLKPEMVLKTAAAAAAAVQNNTCKGEGYFDELLGVNGQTGEDFSVDDLLDFSNDFVLPHVEEQVLDQQQQQQKEYNGDSVGKPCSSENYTGDCFGVTDDFGSLTVPADDLESLEWLSHFVEDSFSGHSSYNATVKMPAVVKTEQIPSEPEAPLQEKSSFPTPVQTKARTKRTRPGMLGWSLGSSSLTESSATSSSSSTSSTTSPPPPSSTYNYPHPVHSRSVTVELVKQPAKKPKRKIGGEYVGGQQPRRCSHCGVQKTPQWRAGPLGAKTLCNACGVRFKSGRLLPEYRPACSPTFCSELHSNNHRKVLEMRKKKEGEGGLAAPVQSF